MIIYDNVIFKLQKSGGISTYWFNLIEKILKANYEIVFLEKENDNILRQLIPIDDGLVLKDFSFRLLPLYLRKYRKPFIFHSSYYRVCLNPNAINVITIHDFVHEKFYSGLRKFLHVYQKRRAIKHAKLIITVSENTKKDLLSLHPNINSESVKVIYNGVSDDFFKLSNSTLNKRDSFLFIGSREKYKNFHNAVKIVSRISNFKMIIVGSNLKSNDIIFLDNYLPDRWTFYLHISNHDLNLLYNSVFALLYVSSYEGFGIPLLESMKAGCPFIALNNSSIPEVAGDAGILLDRLNNDELIKAINYLNSNRDYIINKGFEQVKNFSWEKCYQETISVYNEYLTIQ